MDAARIMKDEAWAAMHGLEPEDEPDAIDAEFMEIVGSCALSKSHVEAIYMHQEHAVQRLHTPANWEQFTDPGTKIVRGNE